MSISIIITKNVYYCFKWHCVTFFLYTFIHSPLRTLKQLWSQDELFYRFLQKQLQNLTKRFWKVQNWLTVYIFVVNLGLFEIYVLFYLPSFLDSRFSFWIHALAIPLWLSFNLCIYRFYELWQRNKNQFYRSVSSY